MNALERVKDIYVNNLDKKALEYLANRGISEETARRFEIGLHSELILTNTLTEHEAKRLRMLSPTLFYDYWPKKENGEYPDKDRRLVYPLYGYQFGSYQLKGFQARSTEEKPFLPHRQLPEVYYGIFNEPRLDGRESIIITEGQNDCLVMEQEGFPSIGILGVHKFRDSNADNLVDHGIRRATLLFDNDFNKSGEKGALRTAEILHSVGIEARIGMIPQVRGRISTDINDLYLWDKKLFREIIRKTIRRSKKFVMSERKFKKERPKSYRKINQILISDLYDFGYDMRSEISVVCMLPGHQDSKASFRYNRDKNIFYCFGCGKGGNIVDFLMAYKGLSENEAIRLLEERLHDYNPN